MIVVVLARHHSVVEAILQTVVTAVATHLRTGLIVLAAMMVAIVAVPRLPVIMVTGERATVIIIRHLVEVVVGPQWTLNLTLVAMTALIRTVFPLHDTTTVNHIQRMDILGVTCPLQGATNTMSLLDVIGDFSSS